METWETVGHGRPWIPCANHWKITQTKKESMKIRNPWKPNEKPWKLDEHLRPRMETEGNMETMETKRKPLETV